MAVTFITKKKGEEPDIEAPSKVDVATTGDDQGPAVAVSGGKKPLLSAQLKKATVHETVATPEKKEPEEVSYTLDGLDDSVQLAEAHTTVAVNLGMTVNLGNYNSAKVGVILTMPCSPKDIDGTFGFAKSWVEDRVQELIDEVVKTKESL